MPEALGPQIRGTSRAYALVLGGPDGGVDGSSLAGEFDGTEAFAARLWPGGDYATLATLPASWDASIEGNPAALDNPEVLLSIPAAAIASLESGTYQVEVILNPGVDDVLAWAGPIAIADGPGSRALPPVYCSARDLLDEATWAGSLQDLGPGHAANFLKERAEARREVDRQVLARWERETRRRGQLRAWHPRRLADELATGRAALQAALDAGRLAPDGTLARVAALYTLHLICRSQVGTKEGDTPFQTLSKVYRRDWLRTLIGWAAAVDLAGDGVFTTLEY